ncbi:MAG: hypothetical protein KKI12_02975, partial [Proteobacteria bacterium]|nr:hypothetical protein [Pseudomonadota bacterium]
ASGSALCGSPRVLKYRPTSDCIPRLAMANTPNIIGSPCRVHRLFEYDRLLPSLKNKQKGHPFLTEVKHEDATPLLSQFPDTKTLLG